MALKNKSSKIAIFIFICLISLVVSAIVKDEGGPIWIGAVLIFFAYKLIFKKPKENNIIRTTEKKIIQNEPSTPTNGTPKKPKGFQKKHLILIGLFIGVVAVLLAEGKYNNRIGIIKETDSTINRLETKRFLEETISQENYTIDKLEKAIATNGTDHSLLLNKAMRFKVFMEGQNYSSKLYGQNCGEISNSINLENMRMRNTYSKGLENSKYLYEIAVSKEPDLPNQYSKIMESQIKGIKDYLGFSSSECNQVLLTLQNRNKGIFNDDKNGDNILSINYLTNPVDELFDNHYQEFSSFNNAPNEDFFLTLQLPKSWKINKKNTYTNASTVAVIEPYEKYLTAIITISIYGKFMPEGVNQDDYSDNDITNIIYDDDEILRSVIKSFNKEIKETDKIKTTLYQMGGKTYIIYLSESDIPNGLVENIKIKSLNTINFHNGKLVKLNFSGISSTEQFSSFPYYSKLFFKILNSVKFRTLKENTIYLTEEQNMKFLNVSIAGFDYKFLLDTGASNLVINKKVLSELLDNGIITKYDYVGKSYAEIADGNIVECENWKVNEINIGNNTIKDIIVSVIDSEDSTLLFGMDGLNKLNVKKLNLQENEIILNHE
jgi:predicted aspartyl protease